MLLPNALLVTMKRAAVGAALGTSLSAMAGPTADEVQTSNAKNVAQDGALVVVPEIPPWEDPEWAGDPCPPCGRG